MGLELRGGVHAAGGQVVVVVVGQQDAADQHRDHPAHVQRLGDDVAQDPEEVGDHHLRHLVLYQEPQVLEQERTDYR